jgi:hypothetical protein
MEIMNHELLKIMGIYIQKSKTFLWPVLDIKSEPIETYLKFGDINHTKESRILIALFHNKNPKYVKEKLKIENSKFYDFTFEDDEFDIVTFNMYSFKSDYDKIINGNYSEISNEYKLFISVVEKNKMVLKCLEPKNNYKEVANILGVYESELAGKELLSPPNPDQETIFINPLIKQQVLENYGFN